MSCLIVAEPGCAFFDADMVVAKDAPMNPEDKPIDLSHGRNGYRLIVHFSTLAGRILQIYVPHRYRRL